MNKNSYAKAPKRPPIPPPTQITPLANHPALLSWMGEKLQLPSRGPLPTKQRSAKSVEPQTPHPKTGYPRTLQLNPPPTFHSSPHFIGELGRGTLPSPLHNTGWVSPPSDERRNPISSIWEVPPTDTGKSKRRGEISRPLQQKPARSNNEAPG